jgi:hypothetical protein
VEHDTETGAAPCALMRWAVVAVGERLPSRVSSAGSALRLAWHRGTAAARAGRERKHALDADRVERRRGFHRERHTHELDALRVVARRSAPTAGDVASLAFLRLFEYSDSRCQLIHCW